MHLIVLQAFPDHHFHYLDKEIKKARDQIADLIDADPDLKNKKDLLSSILCIGTATIPHILAELDDLKKFNHVRESVAFIGLTPREKFSGSPIKGKLRLCKTGHAWLRKALYMPALVSVQFSPAMITFYNRFKEKVRTGKLLSVR